MRGFWNDPDGVSITDWLAAVFTMGYFAVAGIMAIKLYQGSLTDRAVDFFSVFSWPVMTILGGYFGDRIASRFGGKRQSKSRQLQAASASKGDDGSAYPPV